MTRYIDADNLQETFKELHGGKRSLLIDTALTADVRENVKGKWIEDNPREKSMMWRCSVCGRIAYYPTIGKRKGFKKHCGYNYCPNCGADMRGEA